MRERREAILFYKPTCRPCRWMSYLAVLLSLGTMRRVGITGGEADQIYERHPEQRGRLVLVLGDRLVFGRRVFLAVPVAVVRAWVGV
jgi:hypothetical protein